MDFVDSEKYQLLVSADDASFGELYRIYAESMPLREQKPRAVIAKMVGRSELRGQNLSTPRAQRAQREMLVGRELERPHFFLLSSGFLWMFFVAPPLAGCCRWTQ